MSVESTVLGYNNRFSPVEIQQRKITLPLKPDFVLVKTAYASLNPVDIKLKLTSIFSSGIAGLDFSGEIVDVASNLEGRFTKGERVCGVVNNVREGQPSFVGSYALVNVKHQSIITTPKNLSDEEAAALPLVFQTTLNILAKTKLNPDSRVLILGGATAVGSVLIQVLKKVHHIKDIVVTCSPHSAAYVQQLGATQVVDYSSGDLSQKLVQTAAAGKYQAIIDTVGGYGALKVWDKLLRPIQDGSAYVTINGDAEPAKSYSKLLSFKLLASVPRMIFRLLFGRWLGINWNLLISHDNTLFNKSVDIVQDYDIKVRVDSVFPLAEGKKAWDKLNKLGAKGKILIKY